MNTQEGEGAPLPIRLGDHEMSKPIPYMNAVGAAERASMRLGIQVTERSVRRAIKRGELRARHLMGADGGAYTDRPPLVSVRDVDAWAGPRAHGRPFRLKKR